MRICELKCGTKYNGGTLGSMLCTTGVGVQWTLILTCAMDFDIDNWTMRCFWVMDIGLNLERT